jgi:hypothetical protein
MPPNPVLVQRLTGIQQALMAQHLGGRGMPNAAIGGERETFLREFLQKVFPSHRRFATGAITDSTGLLTGQVDIAIEFGFVPSFPMPGTEERLLLAESVACVVGGQVRPDRSMESGARDHPESQGSSPTVLNPIMLMGAGPPAHIPSIAVGYTGHNSIEALQERLDSTPEADRPDAALVIQSGAFVGFGMTASGAFGLYGLCLGINVLFAQIGFAAPNLVAYAADADDAAGD